MTQVVLAVSIGGGAAMIVGAVVGPDVSSVPLLVIGGSWLGLGLIGRRRLSRTALRIAVEGDQVSFSGKRIERTIAATELVRYHQPRSRVGPPGDAYFVAVDGEKVLVAPNMTGLLDVLVEVKQIHTAFCMS